MCIYHIFFICESVDRHLGCVILAFVNIAVVYIGVHAFFNQCSYFLLISTQAWNFWVLQ